MDKLKEKEAKKKAKQDAIEAEKQEKILAVHPALQKLVAQELLNQEAEKKRQAELFVLKNRSHKKNKKPKLEPVEEDEEDLS